MVKQENDIDPDGLRIVIPWGVLQVGSSFFVPCVNLERAEKQVLDIARRLGVSLTPRRRIEAQHLGLRFWRTS